MKWPTCETQTFADLADGRAAVWAHRCKHGGEPQVRLSLPPGGAATSLSPAEARAVARALVNAARFVAPRKRKVRT